MLLKHPSGAGRTLHLHHRAQYTGAQLAALANLSATGSVALTYKSERLGHWCSGSPLYSLLTGLAYLPG